MSRGACNTATKRRLRVAGFRHLLTFEKRTTESSACRCCRQVPQTTYTEPHSVLHSVRRLGSGFVPPLSDFRESWARREDFLRSHRNPRHSCPCSRPSDRRPETPRSGGWLLSAITESDIACAPIPYVGKDGGRIRRPETLRETVRSPPLAARRMGHDPFYRV